MLPPKIFGIDPRLLLPLEGNSPCQAKAPLLDNEIDALGWVRMKLHKTFGVAPKAMANMHGGIRDFDGNFWLQAGDTLGAAVKDLC